MNETLATSDSTDSIKDAANQWENVTNERIDNVDKAREMAKVENWRRDSIKKASKATLEALGRLSEGTSESQSDDLQAYANGVQSIQYDLVDGPKMVEQAGKNYDTEQEAARAAELADRNSHRAEWKNVSDERIEDPIKAAHMASVEDAWRTTIDTDGQRAKRLSEANEKNPFKGLSQQVVQEKSRYDATVTGPRAVEAVGKAYDDLSKPELPKSA